MTTERRRRTIERFVLRVNAGARIDDDLLREVAGILKERIEQVAPRAKKRPNIPPEKLFAAWFAVECDPDYRDLPRTRSGVYAEVGELLGLEPSKIEADANGFESHPKGKMLTGRLTLGLAPYAEAKGMKWPEALPTFEQWLNERTNPTGELARLAYLRLGKRNLRRHKRDPK